MNGNGFQTTEANSGKRWEWFSKDPTLSVRKEKHRIERYMTSNRKRNEESMETMPQSC